MNKFLLILLLCFCCSTVLAEPLTLAQRFERIEQNMQPRHQVQGVAVPLQNIQERMQYHNAPGLSVAVVVAGKLAWAKGYGLADVAENRPVTTDTLFQAASLSKPIAALRALQLAEQGTIDLDTDVNAYLETWKVHYSVYSNGQKVTTRRLLNHTAGATIWGFDGYPRDELIPNTLDILLGKGNTPAIFISGEPGKHWLYSGGGYTILQQMLIDVDKKAFPELMRQFVLQPLGMANSTFDVPLPDSLYSKAATGYNVDSTPVAGKWLNHPELAAAGLWSTPTELIQYPIQIQKIMRQNKAGAQAILSHSSVKAMLTPGKNDHGLGPVVDGITFSHNGSNQGYRSMLVGWLEHDYAVVAMTNVYDDNIIREYVMSVAQEFGLPGFEPLLIDAIALPVADRQKFVGTYDVPELGKLSISLSGQGLTGTPDYYHKTYPLVAQSPTTFINIDTGTEYYFSVENGVVTGFSTAFGEVKKIH